MNTADPIPQVFGAVQTLPLAIGLHGAVVTARPQAVRCYALGIPDALFGRANN
jgi:hypothetical protein